MADADNQDQFEADGVTPKKAAEKPAPTAAEIAALERAARAEGEAIGLKTALAAKPAETKQPEKVFTRAELRALVNDGKITEDDMDATLERQLEAKLSKKVSDTVASTVGASQTADQVNASIGRYCEAFPDINKEGSDLRAKIAAKFADLVKRNHPDSISTELAAIEIICGSLEQKGRKPGPDAHQDVGGAGDGEDKPDNAGWAKGLTPRHKKHYETMIARGVYKGENDPMLKREVARIRGAH